jgi:hypothetical protein
MEEKEGHLDVPTEPREAWCLCDSLTLLGGDYLVLAIFLF